MAHIGFSTGAILEGHKDTCGNQHPAEISALTKRLRKNAGSWNWVLGTAGINDTNWSKVLAEILFANLQAKIRTAARCRSYTGRWNLPSRRTALQKNLGSIAEQLADADRAASRYLLGYYTVANTGTALFRVPRVCSAPIEAAMGEFHEVQRLAIAPTGAVWLDTNPVLGSRDALLQDLHIVDAVDRRAGWPHPDLDGHVALGDLVLRTAPLRQPAA